MKSNNSFRILNLQVDNFFYNISGYFVTICLEQLSHNIAHLLGQYFPS